MFEAARTLGGAPPKRHPITGWRHLLAAAALAACLFAVLPATASAGAINRDAGCLANVLPRNDDGSSGQVNIGQTINFYGQQFSTLWVNNNGNVTLTGPMSTFTPFNLYTAGRPLMAPFFSDVDTRPSGSGEVTWGHTTVGGRPAFCANWTGVAFDGVGYYNFGDDRLNSFQLLLVDRTETGPGNFDMVFNYDKVQWDRNGSVRAGFSNGTAANSHEFEGSGQAGAFLDSNPSGLIHRGSPPGSLTFAVREGAPEPVAGDTTPPVVTPSTTGTRDDSGWYTTDVGLSWSVVDDESDISGSDGCAPVTISADQDSTTYTCTATSEGGTTVETVSIKRDATAPTVQVTGVTDGATYTVGAVPSADCDTQDATSGVAQPASVSSTGGPMGTVTATCSGATDNAGNSAGAVSASYAVRYAFSGFFRPIDNGGVLNSVKAGSAVPVKFSLAGNRGLSILASGSPSSQVVTCDANASVDPVEETSTAGGSSLSYDAAADQYVYVWKTDKSWAGTCRQLRVTLIDGSSHTARFKLTK
jgi:hypothetical protein